MFLDYFDVLMSTINFKNKKNIILIYFQTKNTLKNNYNHSSSTPKLIIIEIEKHYIISFYLFF